MTSPKINISFLPADCLHCFFKRISPGTLDWWFIFDFGFFIFCLRIIISSGRSIGIFTPDRTPELIIPAFRLSFDILRSSFPFTDGDVYVFGELTDWQLQDDAKLRYNKEFDFWEAELFRKPPA